MITIAIVIVCLALLGFLIYKIVDLTKTPDAATVEAMYDDYNSGDDFVNYDDEVYNSETEPDMNDSGDLDDDDVNYADEGEYDMGNDDIAEEDGVYDNTEDEYAADDEAGDEADNYGSAAEDEAPTSYSSSGQYMVIAGSYRQRVNADNQVSRLRSMGYNSAEVRLFDRGSYALVVVDRFSSKSEASSLVSQLGTKGVEAFVQRKR